MAVWHAIICSVVLAISFGRIFSKIFSPRFNNIFQLLLHKNIMDGLTIKTKRTKLVASRLSVFFLCDDYLDDIREYLLSLIISKNLQFDTTKSRSFKIIFNLFVILVDSLYFSITQESLSKIIGLARM
jgi:hypothetical protein